jgi:hypothetical protein
LFGRLQPGPREPHGIGHVHESDTCAQFQELDRWEKQSAKNAQKDKDTRWTKKNDESFDERPRLEADKGRVLHMSAPWHITSVLAAPRPGS